MEVCNEIKIGSLNDGWHDKDEIMLHACFQLLKDFVEKENLDIIDWAANAEHEVARKEIQTLYEWWNKKLLSLPGTVGIDKKEYEEENEMLFRLIKIREYLWT
ncbi:MAG TPA: hypothetical protein VK174_05415 [Chitinophagales bacterium]|nr:hypothetical protein [Chitinophagales bacterium]